MIESYSFCHSGGLEAYLDKVYVSYGIETYVTIVNGMNDVDSCARVSKAILNVFDSKAENADFKSVSAEISKKVKSTDEYLLVSIDDSRIITEQHGDVKGYLVRDGSIVRITNGLINLHNEDRIIFATGRFLDKLSEEMILIDALTSLSAEEWMDFLVCRISEINMLSGNNRSAVTLIVRNTEDIKLV